MLPRYVCNVSVYTILYGTAYCVAAAPKTGTVTLAWPVVLLHMYVSKLFIEMGKRILTVVYPCFAFVVYKYMLISVRAAVSMALCEKGVQPLSCSCSLDSMLLVCRSWYCIM
jgi:hypothetical protein